MKTETLDIVEIEECTAGDIIVEEESLEEQLTYLLVAKDETLAEIYAFGDEEYLIEKLQKIEKEIEKLKKIINSNQ
jgi:hypothetical protein